jgi:hypothetical protein
MFSPRLPKLSRVEIDKCVTQITDTSSSLTFVKVASVGQNTRFAVRQSRSRATWRTGGWSFSTMRPRGSCLPPPRHCVVYRGEGVSMDVSVGGGGRVHGIWRFRAPVQSGRLRIITAGCREVPRCPPPCVLYKYTAIFFVKKGFIRCEFCLFSSNNCFRGTYAETRMGCIRLAHFLC